jgi:hypothetical protein
MNKLEEEIKKKVSKEYPNVGQSKISYIDPPQSSCCESSQTSCCESSQAPCCGATNTELKEMADINQGMKVEPKIQPEITTKSTYSDQLKLDIYVPLDACSCVWSEFMNSMFVEITPYIKHIMHETKSTNSEEARRLNIHNKCVIIDGEKKFTSSHALKNALPKLLEEKGII